jgi:hypothetical protein
VKVKLLKDIDGFEAGQIFEVASSTSFMGWPIYYIVTPTGKLGISRTIAEKVDEHETQ